MDIYWMAFFIFSKNDSKWAKKPYLSFWETPLMTL